MNSEAASSSKTNKLLQQARPRVPSFSSQIDLSLSRTRYMQPTPLSTHHAQNYSHHIEKHLPPSSNSKITDSDDKFWQPQELHAKETSFVAKKGPDRDSVPPLHQYILTENAHVHEPTFTKFTSKPIFAHKGQEKLSTILIPDRHNTSNISITSDLSNRSFTKGHGFTDRGFHESENFYPHMPGGTINSKNILTTSYQDLKESLAYAAQIPSQKHVTHLNKDPEYNYKGPRMMVLSQTTSTDVPSYETNRNYTHVQSSIKNRTQVDHYNRPQIDTNTSFFDVLPKDANVSSHNLKNSIYEGGYSYTTPHQLKRGDIFSRYKITNPFEAKVEDSPYVEKSFELPQTILKEKSFNKEEAPAPSHISSYLARDQFKNIKEFKDNNPYLRLHKQDNQVSRHKENVPRISLTTVAANEESTKFGTPVSKPNLQENYSPNFEESPIKVNPIRVFKRANVEEKTSKEEKTKRMLSNTTSFQPLELAQIQNKPRGDETKVKREKSINKKHPTLKKIAHHEHKHTHTHANLEPTQPKGHPSHKNYHQHYIHPVPSQRNSNNSEKILSQRKSYEDCLLEETIFRTLLDYLCMKSLCLMTRVSKKFRSNEAIAAIKKAQCRVILKGLSEEEQYEFWDLNVNFYYLQKTYPLQYAINSMKTTRYERDVLSDVDRTRFFNNTPISKQESVMRILLAIANSCPKIGYVQGMNVIASVFLASNLKDSEVFWLIRYILHKKKFEEILLDGFPRVQLLNYQLDVYARIYLPELITYLTGKEINVSYFATQWFITMFAYDLNYSHIIKIWNFFFIKSWKMLIRVALSLLWHFKDRICKQSVDELPEFLKTCLRENIGEIPEDELFKIAFSFKVSNRLLRELETFYKNKAPKNLTLVPDEDHHLEWKLETESPHLPILVETKKDSPTNIMTTYDFQNQSLEIKTPTTTGNILTDQAFIELPYTEINKTEYQDPLNTSSVLAEKVLTSAALAAKNKANRLDASVDFSKGFSGPNLSNIKANKPQESSRFMQTLSNFGKRISQMWTPKDESIDLSQTADKIIINTEQSDKVNPPLSERSSLYIPTSLVKKDSRQTGLEDGTDSAHSRNSMINNAFTKDFLQSIQPFNDSFNRDDEEGHHGVATNDLFEKVEKDILYAPKRAALKQRRDSQITSELVKNLRKAKTDEYYHDKDMVVADMGDLTGVLKIPEDKELGPVRHEWDATLVSRLSMGGFENKENRPSARLHVPSDPTGAAHCDISMDIFGYKENRKIPSKKEVDEFDLSEDFL